MIVKKAEIKAIAGERNYRVSKEFYEELDNKVLEMIEKAIIRANSNGRKTLKGYDL
jgi:histone H3/H4